MRHVLLASIVLLDSAAGQSALPWRQLLDRGESEKAAAILHPLVFEVGGTSEPPMPDAEAAAALAQLYLAGTGVEQDRIIACSFTTLATASAMFRYHIEGHPVVARMEQLQAAACGGLSTEEREEAGQMAGCPRYAPAPQTFAVDVDYSMEINRRGIRIRYRGKETIEPLLSLGCPQRVALVRHTRVEPRGGAAEVPARHFLEVFTWIPTDTQSARQVLVWQLGEVAGGSIEWHAFERLGEQAGSPWMETSAAVPAEIGAVRFAMRPTGEVTWRFEGAERSGVLNAAPESETADPAPPLPETGTAHVDVTAKDRFGAPLIGARVKLTGVVTREVTVGETGTVSFDNLPDGRYDVVASATGLAASVARVLDLSGPGVTDVHLTLKPWGPHGMTTLACGGFDSGSIRALRRDAHVVLHLKVTDSRTTERPTEGHDLRGLSTFTDVRVLRSFKKAALEPAAGTTLTLEQPGGRIDRGEHIDVHTFNDLGPLNVGDEYVVFITYGPKGTLWIHGSEEGAFRIRNGQVEPLGDGGAARAWKGRTSASFFEALEKGSR